MDDLTFDEFADFIREYWHVSDRKKVSPETQFERDLGLTGDDGAAGSHGEAFWCTSSL
jgi:hypothetical protein